MAKLGCRARESQVRVIQATQVNLGILNKDRRIVNKKALYTDGELNLHQATLNKTKNQVNQICLNATKILNTVLNLKNIKILTAKGKNFPKQIFVKITVFQYRRYYLYTTAAG